MRFLGFGKTRGHNYESQNKAESPLLVSFRPIHVRCGGPPGPAAAARQPKPAAAPANHPGERSGCAAAAAAAGGPVGAERKSGRVRCAVHLGPPQRHSHVRATFVGGGHAPD